MHESAGWLFDVEVHPPDWRFPVEKSWIAGWIRPATGKAITDIRARIHHRVILGLTGLPHPAGGEKSPGQPDLAGAGFSFLLAPQPGATRLRLEARDASGRWTEFFRTKISAAPGAPVPPPFPGLNPSLRRLATDLLKRRLRAPERSWTDLAGELMAAFVAEPLNADPNPPFAGALEEPRDTGRLRYGRISVTGWLAHPDIKITRLSAVIDPLPATTLSHGRARPDIAPAFPALGDQANSAFVGEIVLPPDLATPVLLKIFAELANGEKHLVFARRFTPHHFQGSNEQIPPLVPGATFARAIWALLRAARQHAVPGRGLIRTARTAWSSYKAMPAYRPKGIRSPREKPKSRANREPPRAMIAGASTPDGAAQAALLPALPTCTAISPADDMCVPDASQYFHIGRAALRLVVEASALAECGRIDAILDLPCGFGRVARWLRTAYPAAQLTVSDTQDAGVAFCVEHLEATGVRAAADGSHWAALPGPYDIIWCGSLLTHFDWNQWVNHLQRFAERLSPQGVLVFTSHGLHALDLLQSGEKDYGLPPAEVARLCTAAVTEGFGYADYRDTPGYGISVSQSGWIRELIPQETDLHVLAIHEAAWGGHQDVVVCARRAPR